MTAACRYWILFGLLTLLSSCHAWSLRQRRSVLAALGAAWLPRRPSSADTNVESILRQVQPATDEQPRIPLPDQVMIDNKVLVQGLLSISSSTTRLDPDAIILLTVQFENQVVAGAQIPARRVRLPLRFSLSTDNWISDTIPPNAVTHRDVTVVAEVCRSLAADQTCVAPWFHAKSVAKVVRLAAGPTVRAPVSLVLE